MNFQVIRIPTYWFCFTTLFLGGFLFPFFLEAGWLAQPTLSILAALYINGWEYGADAAGWDLRWLFFWHMSLATIGALAWMYWLDRRGGVHASTRRYGLASLGVCVVALSACLAVARHYRLDMFAASCTLFPILTYPLAVILIPWLARRRR